MDYWIRCLHIPNGWYLGKWKYKKTEDGTYHTTQRCYRTRCKMVAYWKGQVNILEHSITLGSQLFFLVSTTFSNHFEVVWVVDIKMGTLGHRVFFWCRIHLWFRLMGGVCKQSRWRHSVTEPSQDGGYVLLWQHYDNNKMVAMRYYSSSSTVQS